MVCRRCVEALEAAGHVLYELHALDRAALPEGTDWVAVGAQLVQLAGVLRAVPEPLRNAISEFDLLP